MLEKQDLSQIRDVVKDEVSTAVSASEKRMFEQIDQSAKSVTENVTKNVTTTIIEAVGEMIEQNVLPQLDQIRSQMVTKHFLEERLTKFKDSLTDSSLWVGKKLNRLTDVLYHNGTITTEQLLHVQRGHKTT